MNLHVISSYSSNRAVEKLLLTVSDLYNPDSEGSWDHVDFVRVDYVKMYFNSLKQSYTVCGNQ